MASSTRGKFLQRRGLSWYARVRVPASLQSKVGNTHLRKALGTKNKAEAERKKWKVVAELKAYLDRVKRGDSSPAAAARKPTGPREVADEIRRLRAEGDDDQAEIIESVAWDHADGIREKVGKDAAARWFLAATTEAPSLDELLSQWLESSSYKEQTKSTYRRAYAELRAMLGFADDESLFAAQVTDDVVVRYVVEFLPAHGYSGKSISVRLGALSSLWTFLQQRLVIPLGRNPWKGHRIARPKVAAEKEDERAFTEPEMVALLKGTARAKSWEVYPRVRDLLVLGMYTGARLNELASLRVKDVVISDDASSAVVSIREGKTKAATRSIAVTHWAALEVITRRTRRKAPGAQLFDELSPGGPDGKLSWTASKAFTRYRRACGVPDGTDYHSLRRTFLTLHEHRGTDYVAVARFVGHQVPTMMHAVYSAGASDEALLKVADATRYSPAVEKAVSSLAN